MSGAGTLSDIDSSLVLGFPVLQLVLVVLLGAYAYIGLILVLMWLVPSMGPTGSGVVFGCTVLGVIVWVAAQYSRTRKRSRLLAEGVSRDGVVPTMRVICDTLGPWSVSGNLMAVVRILVSRGQCGVTMRIGPGWEGPPIEPIPWPFEPQPLDEATSALLIDQAATKRPLRSSDDDPAAGGAVLRAIRRNVRLHGGVKVVVAVAFIWAWHVLLAVIIPKTRVVLAFWTVALVAVLLISPRRASRRWLVVPAGLVWRRRSHTRGRNWDLRLFERRSSVLCAVPMGRTRYRVFVADGAGSGTFVATTSETEFLLRAWLSPCPTPPVKRLSDFR